MNKITLEQNGEKWCWEDVSVRTFQSVQNHLEKFGGIPEEEREEQE